GGENDRDREGPHRYGSSVPSGSRGCGFRRGLTGDHREVELRDLSVWFAGLIAGGSVVAGATTGMISADAVAVGAGEGSDTADVGVDALAVSGRAGSTIACFVAA